MYKLRTDFDQNGAVNANAEARKTLFCHMFIQVLLFSKDFASRLESLLV